LRQRLFAALHSSRLRRLRAKPLDEALLPRDLALLPRRGAVLLLQAVGLLPLVVAVVAGVALDTPIAQFEDPRRHAIEEVGVVRLEGLEQAPLLFDQRVEIVPSLYAVRHLLQLQLEAARLWKRHPQLCDQLAVRLVPRLLPEIAERAAAMPARALVRPIFAGK